MSSNRTDIAISVEGIGKQYRIGHARTYKRLTESIMSIFGPRTTSSESFWAVQDVSFEVKRGEVIGLVGRNGAGKSTLLRMLSRITIPTCGKALLNGRTGSLLEVGTGFHPELTGRENIYLNGAILGMRHSEISRKFDDIVEFAEVEKFVDTPIKHFSSGMYLRLAFAVAAHLETEILLVDEVLAVGDFAFQKKCLGKMSTVAKDGRTIIFVSHNMAAIHQLCSRAVLMKNGRLASDGPAADIVREYLDLAVSEDGKKTWDEGVAAASGSKAYPLSLVMRNQSGAAASSVAYQDHATIEMTVKVVQPMTFQTSFVVQNALGMRVFSSEAAADPQKYEPGVYKFTATLPASFLAPGRYQLLTALYYPNSEMYFMDECALAWTVEETGSPYARYTGDVGVVVAPVRWQMERLEVESVTTAS